MTIGELRSALSEYPDEAVVRVEGCDCTLPAEEVGPCLAYVGYGDQVQQQVLIRSGGVSYMERDEDGLWRGAVGLVEKGFVA